MADNFERAGVELQVIGLGEYEVAIKRARDITSSAFGDQTAKAVASLFPELDRIANGFSMVGKAAVVGFNLVVGAAAVAGTAVLALATAAAGLTIALGAKALEAAIKFESAMVGIRRTMEPTAIQFQIISDDIRELAKTIPFTTAELGKIGEAAGRMGVKANDAVPFIRAMADAVTTSTMTAEEAVNTYGRLATLLDHPIDQITQLTSAVTELDNNLTTNEQEIAGFTLRMAAAGNVTGLSTAAILGTAASFRELGIRAELGGTAVNTALFMIADAVAGGGAKLTAFATVANMQAAEFAKLWREDASEAWIRFVEGLGEGGDRMSAILKEVGLGNQRAIQAFSTLADSHGSLRANIELTTAAMARGNATQIEASRVYATTESGLKVLANTVNDLFIEVGLALLPTLKDLLGALRDDIIPMASRFADTLATMVIPQILDAADAVFTHLNPGLAGLTDKGDKAERAAIALGDALAGLILTIPVLVSWVQLATVRVNGLGAAFAGTGQVAAGFFRVIEAGSRGSAVDMAVGFAQINSAQVEFKTTTEGITGAELEFQRALEATVAWQKQQVDVGRQRRTEGILDAAQMEMIQDAVRGGTDAIREQIAVLEGQRGALEGMDEVWNRNETSINTLKGELTDLERNQARARKEFEAGAGAADRFNGMLGDTEEKAKKAKSALEALGISAKSMREAMDLLGFSTDYQREVLLALGVEALEAGEIIEGLNVTVDALAAAFNRAGLQGDILAAKIPGLIEAKKAQAKAEKEAEEAAEKAAAAAIKAAEDQEAAYKKAADSMADFIMDSLRDGQNAAEGTRRYFQDVWIKSIEDSMRKFARELEDTMRAGGDVVPVFQKWAEAAEALAKVYKDLELAEEVAKIRDELATLGEMEFGITADNMTAVQNRLEMLKNDHKDYAESVKSAAESAVEAWMSQYDRMAAADDAYFKRRKSIFDQMKKAGNVAWDPEANGGVGGLVVVDRNGSVVRPFEEVVAMTPAEAAARAGNPVGTVAASPSVASLLGTRGGTSIEVTANYALTQSPVTIRDDLEAMKMGGLY